MQKERAYSQLTDRQRIDIESEESFKKLHRRHLEEVYDDGEGDVDRTIMGMGSLAELKNALSTGVRSSKTKPVTVASGESITVGGL